MKIKLNTEEFKDILKALNLVAGKYPHLPLTTVVTFTTINNKLICTTTDTVHYMSCLVCEVEEDFNISVDVTKLYKIINSTTVGTIEIKLKDKSLEIKGNGKYYIPALLNGVGDIALIPNKMEDYSKDNTINISKLSEAISYLKKTVAPKEFELQSYCNYVFKETSALSCNSKLACKYISNPLNSDVFLLNRTSSILIETNRFGDELFFDSEKNIFANNRVFLKVMFDSSEYEEEFQTEDILNIFNVCDSLKNRVELNSEDIQDIIKRLSIFCEKDDSIEISLKDSSILFSSINKEIEETLVVNSELEFNIQIDLLSLTKIIPKSSIFNLVVYDNKLFIISDTFIYVSSCLVR